VAFLASPLGRAPIYYGLIVNRFVGVEHIALSPSNSLCPQSFAPALLSARSPFCQESFSIRPPTAASTPPPPPVSQSVSSQPATMQSLLPEIVTSHAVKDLLNESFHEHRPSFKSLTFEKGSFSIASSNRSIHKILKKNKSNKNSFVSSISTDLGFISEDEPDEDRDSGDDDDEEDEDDNNNTSVYYGTSSKESLRIESDLLHQNQRQQKLQMQPGLVMEEEEEGEEGDVSEESETSPINNVGKNFLDLFVLGGEVSGDKTLISSERHWRF
jgi:hypothetical protein